MANVIKHKRGSGSDPVANDLVVGEVAIRTDTGKLFTKMDNGSVAEIAGGGSDIAINTLSSSSGAGGGSATFNGSAYRFTLSQPPSVSAYQLLVSINGVIQKPVSGTGQPSEGFAVDGTDIILGDAPETGADFFILTFKSLGVSEPADNSVTSAKIVDGAIVNADVNASAAIAGTKISPDFGSQNIVTTGKVGINETALSSFNSIADDLIISQASGSAGITIRSGTGNTGVLAFTDGANTNFRGDLRYDHNGDYMRFSTDGDERMRIDSSGRLVIGTTAASSAGNSQYSLFEVSGNTSGATGPGHLSIKRGTASASLSNGDTIGRLIFSGLDGGDFAFIQASVDADNTTDFPGRLMFYTCADGATSATERMRINSSGKVGIGTSSPAYTLDVVGDGGGSFSASTNSTQGQISIVGKNSGGSVSAISRIKSHPDGSSNQSHMAFETRNSSATMVEAMRITSDQKVGIGTTSPDRTIHCHNSSNTTNVRAKFSNGTTGEGASDGFEIGINASDPAQAVLVNYEASPMAFFTNASERMRIASNGDIGIGTTTLNRRDAGRPLVQFDYSGSDASQGLEVRLSNSAINGNASTDNLQISYIGQDFSINNTENGNIVFYNNGSERLRIDSSGNVGIGTSSPSDRLEIQNTTSDKGILLKSTGNNFHTICGDANRSQATDNILRLDAKWNGSVVSRIRMLAGNDTTNKDDGIICFDTDSGSGMSERMRIDSSGQVLIGTTSSGGPGGLTIAPFHDDGACTLIFDRANTSDTSTVLAFENNNSGVGSITHGNSSTSFNTSSDYRLKENVTAISDGITRLKTLKPYRFNFKVDDSKTVDGFFAHEVTAVPEAITGTKDETQDILYTEDDTIPSGKKIGDVKEVQPVYQGIDQSKLVPLLTAALQEAVGKIETLETKVAALEAK